MFYKEIKDAMEWKELLKRREHWKTGYSAKELAYCWQNSKPKFPSKIAEVFRENNIEAEIFLAIPEYCVAMPGGRQGSQNDIFVLAIIDSKLCPIMVEGKRDEPLGEYCDSKKEQSSRCREMLKELSLDETIEKKLRYQLLHRTLSALYTARALKTGSCMLLFHHINGSKNASFKDYAYFLSLFNVNALKGEVQTARIKDMDVLFLWVEDPNIYSDVQP